MNVDEETIRNRSTDAVFERGQNYREEGRIQQLARFGDLVTATVSGLRHFDDSYRFDLERAADEYGSANET